MDTTGQTEHNAKIRAIESGHLIWNVAHLLAEYDEQPGNGAIAARVEQLRLLVREYLWAHNEIPLLESLMADTVDRFAIVYRDVSSGKVANAAEQRQALEAALASLGLLPDDANLLHEILDAAVRSVREIRDRDRRTRSGGGPRETAKVVVGKLRPKLFARVAAAKGLPPDTTSVVARDGMHNVSQRRKMERLARPDSRTFLNIVMTPTEEILADLLDPDLYIEAHEGLWRVVEKQNERRRKARAATATSSE